MKKVLCIISVLCSSVLIQGQCTQFYDGFESGTYTPTWQVGTGTYVQTVTTASPAVGNYSFEQASAGSNSFYQGTYTTFAPFQPVYISWYAKTNTTNAANGYMVSGDANIAADNGILFCYFNATSQLRFFNTTGYNHPIVANTWYHIEAKNIDYVNRNMDIYIDGVLILNDWGFRSPSATAFDRIHLFSLSAATVTYDEFIWGYMSPVINNFTVTNVGCSGDTTGSIDITATAGSMNGYLQYTWSNSDTTQDITDLLSGNYIVNITDSIGCITTDSFMVYEPAPLSSSGIVTNVTCNGDMDGEIDLSVAGGSPGSGYNYLWLNDSTTSEDVINLTAGNYIVNITDSAGCTWQDTFDVSEPPIITINSIVTDLNCSEDSSGSIDLAITGGNPGYTFNWSNSSTSEDITGLAAGNYTVIVTDTLGCTNIDYLFVSEPTPISATAVVTNDNGTSNGAIDLTVTGGTPGYTFSWSNTATSEDLTGLSAGTFIVTITDSNSCESIDTVVVFSTAGTEENTTSSIHVWPVPFADVINVQITEISSETSMLFITDMNGKLVANYTIPPFATGKQIQIEENLPNGIYFLSIIQDEKRFVAKLIRNR